jgi:hypothetical protein
MDHNQEKEKNKAIPSMKTLEDLREKGDCCSSTFELLCYLYLSYGTLPQFPE